MHPPGAQPGQRLGQGGQSQQRQCGHREQPEGRAPAAPECQGKPGHGPRHHIHAKADGDQPTQPTPAAESELSLRRIAGPGDAGRADLIQPCGIDLEGPLAGRAQRRMTMKAGVGMG